jgi:excisionase family DNA binding protein
MSTPDPDLSAEARRHRRGGNDTPPITVSVEEASRITGLGQSTIRRLAYTGKLRSTRVLARRLIFVDGLNDLLKKEAPVTAG